MLFFNTTFAAKSIMVPVNTFFSFRVSSRFLNAGNSFSCVIFGYNLIQADPPHALYLDIILQYLLYIKYCRQITLEENEVFLGIRG